ncbi:KEOPS complex subunit Pcc1 [uncultured Methanobrevibacter sp.]|uniref:KEOPS complex subunit Pcc1 n=1 Tax=uncultured Methanobrevibacter sp. TaxID=253161 RepID=UPI0025EA9E46|nr:KEOPS complex subunit Pcc1 [uncultured Methanobrevibacter sp.]
MKIKSKLTLNYKTKEAASLIYDSLEIDNENYVKGNVEDRTIEYEIDSHNLGSYLATVDDLISSEIVAEKIIDKTKS